MCLLALISLSVVFAANGRAAVPNSDGKYNWAFARSLVFDRDLNFTNDYKLCGDPGGLAARGKVPGRPDNSFYIGPSLVWAPALALARVVVPLPEGASDGEEAACHGRYVRFVLYVGGPLLATVILFLCYRSARRVASDGAAAAATALLGLGGSLAAYASELPWIGHIHSALAAALLLLATLRARELPERIWRWVAVAAALALVVLERTTDALLVVVPAAVAVMALRRQRLRLVAVGGLLAAGLMVGALPQMLISRYLNGTWAPSMTSNNYLHLDQAHPWLLLFAPHGGLFYYTPTSWLAVVGAGLALRDRAWRPLVAALLAAVVLAVWVNSAVLDWHGSGTFGARRLVFLTPVFVLFGAFLTEGARRLLVARPGLAVGTAALALVVPLVATNLMVVTAQGNVYVRIEGASPQAGLYGASREMAWSYVDRKLGPVAVLPAVVAFRLRYGLPPLGFYRATETIWYKRDWMTLAWRARDVAIEQVVVTGATVATKPDKMRLRGGRATLVFAAQWPFATHVILKTWAPRPARLRVGRGRLWGTVPYGELAVGPTEQRQEVTIPAGGFGSGIVELVFETDQPDVEIRAVGLDDRTPRTPPWASLSGDAADGVPEQRQHRPRPGEGGVGAGAVVLDHRGGEVGGAALAVDLGDQIGKDRMVHLEPVQAAEPRHR